MAAMNGRPHPDTETTLVANVDFYLASRSEHLPDDFDGGGIRACRSLRRIRDAFVVDIDPPIHDNGELIVTVVLVPRHCGYTLPPATHEEVYVHVSPYRGDDSLWRGEFRSRWWGEVAADPALFGPTDAEAWERDLDRIRRFAEAHGRVGPPYPDTDEGTMLRNLIHNVRMDHGDGDLDSEIEARLEAIPGWSWSD